MKKLYFPILLMLALVSKSSIAQKDVIQETAKQAVDKKAITTDTTEGWSYDGYMSLSFSQISLNNWAAGGKGSFSTLGNVNVNAVYQKKRFKWENTLNMNYGTIKETGGALQKNDDRIELISHAGYKATEKGNFYYTGLASFRTQFHATFNENGRLVSNFMSPAWLQAAIGMSYSYKKNFSVIVAPVAGKFTIVQDQRLADSGAYGVDPAVIDPVTFQVITPGSTFRSEIGAYLYLTFKAKLMENVTYSTRFDLFTNYSDEERRGLFDVNWENLITLKVNKYISTSFFTHLIYDQDIPVDVMLEDGTQTTGPRTQFKTVLGVGLSYKF